MEEAIRYRPAVAAILQRKDGMILIFERTDSPGSWQFPQGGVELSEEHDDALMREVEEETGIRPHSYSISDKKGEFQYRFPNGKIKKGYHGQSQTYYLLMLHDPIPQIDLEQADDEFSSYRWIHPEEFRLEWIPPFKRDVYARVLGAFFGQDTRDKLIL